MNTWLSFIVALGSTPSVAPVAAWAAPPASPAAAPLADDAYVRAVASDVAIHVEAGRYDQALAVLDAAERERPLSVFIYVRATIEERRGNCERAANLYHDFLDGDVPDADAEDARAGEDRCREQLGLAPIHTGGGPTSGEVAGSSTGAADEQGDEPATPPWYADPWGGVLVVGGVAGLGAGVGLYVQSRADDRAAADATSLQAFEDRSRRAVRLNRAGIVTMAIGSALLAAGVVRYALLATRTRRRVALAPGWMPAGVALSADVRF